MSEDKIIKNLNNFVAFAQKEENFTYYSEYKFDNELADFVQGLLDLYQKEKEKNKELSEELTERICKNVEAEVFEEMRLELKQEKEKNKQLENADLTTVYMNGFYDGENKWKDKIKEIIKQLENDIKKTRDKKYRAPGEYISDYDKVRLKAYITKTEEIKKRLQELVEEN